MADVQDDDKNLQQKLKASDEPIGAQEPPIIGSWLESKTSLLDDELLFKLEQALEKSTDQYQISELVHIALDYDPIDLAHAITKLPSFARLIVYKSLPDDDAKASFLIHTTSPTRSMIFRAVSDQELQTLIERMPPDEAVTVVEDLPVRRIKRLLEGMESSKATKILELRQHRPHTSGRIMTNEFFSFKLSSTVSDATSFIRHNPGIELTRWIFVTDDDGRLVGYVPDRNLIVNSGATPLTSIMRPIPHFVHPDTPRDEVVELFERYELFALPVVSSSHALLGVITQADVVQVMEDIADDTIANIGGTAEDTRDDEPLINRFFSRAPWLLVTLFGGLLTATGLSLFQGQPWFIVVPFFVPLITGMSGNIGIQCSTLLVRGIAMGEVSYGTRRHIILRELRIGSLIGIIFGALCGISVYGLNNLGLNQGLQDPLLVGMIVSAGILGASFTATLLGTLSPLLFAHIGIDPAIASGPIVTACNDVLSTYMYFLVAWLVSSFFSFLSTN